MRFKENLRRLREQAGWTQTEMAGRAGVPFRSYQNWEAGVREPRIAALAALADALGVSVDDLIRGDGVAGRKAGGRTRKRSEKAERRPP
jgi:transcriptional regulator with XRE-family HTH domain